MSEVVVFDMDGTLLSNDSTKKWILKSLTSNFLRFSGAVLIMPVALPLMKIKKYKLAGVSLFLWMATFGLSNQQLEKSFVEFSENIKKNSINDLYWFNDGIDELKAHINNGREVIIVTAAPEFLASILIRSIGVTAVVIGTPLIKKLGGWVGRKHCRHNEKIRRLALIGIKGPWYATYSDDINDDYPILLNSKNPFLINSKNDDVFDGEIKNIKKLTWF